MLCAKWNCYVYCTHSPTTTTFSLQDWFEPQKQESESIFLFTGVHCNVSNEDVPSFSTSLVSLPLRFASCDRHGFIRLCFSSLPLLPCNLVSLTRHTHELKQLPWYWPSEVFIYSLFTHSCWWHFRNTGIVCVWDCRREERHRYRGRLQKLSRRRDREEKRGWESTRKREREVWENIGSTIFYFRENNARLYIISTSSSYRQVLFCFRLIKGIDRIAARPLWGCCTHDSLTYTPPAFKILNQYFLAAITRCALRHSCSESKICQPWPLTQMLTQLKDAAMQAVHAFLYTMSIHLGQA